MLYKISDLIVEYNPIYDMLRKRSDKYLIKDSSTKVNFKIIVNENDIKKVKDSDQEINSELAEYIVAGAILSNALLQYKGCLLHSSAVVIDNECYLFSATSGTGKSTHTNLWIKYLSDKKPYILNDDKPAIRIIDNEIWAYGTPFSGKYDINKNKKAKVKSICFIQQSKTNTVEKMENDEAIKLFMEQILVETDKESMIRLLEIVDIIIRQVPVYKLKCNISEEAVRLSYETMKKSN